MRVPAARPLAMRVISHNIRYAADPPDTNEAPWPQRLPDLLAQIRYHAQYAPDTLLCLQEVLDGQLHDILSGLNSNGEDWLHIGVGRDDGVRAGEYAPILYRSSVWELKDFSYFWLSETPHCPSRGWDAGSIRIVTIGKFRNRRSKHDIVAFNIHLDNSGSIARARGATLVLESIRSYLDTSSISSSARDTAALPVVLAGDLNSSTDQEAYRVFSGPDSPLVDVKRAVPAGHVYGYDETFTGFSNDGEGRIDHIFASHKLRTNWELVSYATLPNVFQDASGVRFSDHRAVVADLRLRAL